MANVVEQQSENYPSMESICLLFRSIINDTFNDGAGQIATDSAPFMLPYLNAAIRDLFSDLRLINSLTVIRDNYILTGLNAIATTDPTVQTNLTYSGYYNGASWNSSLSLPADLLWVTRLWQRATGTAEYFYPMTEYPAGLPSGGQGNGFSGYEVRSDGIWFAGALQGVDLRIRYVAKFPDFAGTSIDFANTYVPIADCTNAVAQKMVALYAQRLSPDQFPLAEQQAVKFTKKLKDESIRNSQNKAYSRPSMFTRGGE